MVKRFLKWLRSFERWEWGMIAAGACLCIFALTVAVFLYKTASFKTGGFNDACESAVDYLAQERVFQVCILSSAQRESVTTPRDCANAAQRLAKRTNCAPRHMITLPELPPAPAAAYPELRR